MTAKNVAQVCNLSWRNTQLTKLCHFDSGVQRAPLWKNRFGIGMKFFETLAQTFANKPIDWDELEASFIRADLGVEMTTRIIERLREREAWSLTGISDVIKLAREEILRILPAKSEPIAPVA